MSDIEAQLNERFAPHNASLAQDVMRELQSILRLHSISPQELFYKWESYSIKMGAEDSPLSLSAVRDLKKDLNESLDRESRAKTHPRHLDKKSTAATPRNARAASDVFGLIDGVTADSPRLPMGNVDVNSVKRKSNFDSPVAKASKTHTNSSPQTAKDAASPAQSLSFADRPNAGAVVYTLNQGIRLPDPLAAPFSEPRIGLKANTEMSKFSYKPMAMKLSAASEILDDRIDSFVELVQAHYSIDDGAFGNPTTQSTNEIVAVGRITSDSDEGKLNESSILLETSRKMGGGLRVPLHLEALSGYDLFPGKIVALRGSNASGEYFAVTEILDMPLPNHPASTLSELDSFKARLQGGISDADKPHPLNIMISSGPYTADTNLDFEPLQALCDQAKETCADALILIGPFLDTEHPHVASGNIPSLSPALQINPDTATLTDVFRGLIGLPLQRLAQAVPGITIIMVPSVRDVVNKHVSWPQDRIAKRKKDLGLPKQVAIVTNPVLLSLNEVMFGISSQDTLYELSQERCARGSAKSGPGEEFGSRMARLSRHMIEQRHFYPLFPPAMRDCLPKPSADGIINGEVNKATGSMLDVSYLALGEWQTASPDVLISPSVLEPFAAGVEGIVVMNPGTLSKKRGGGTFVRMTVETRRISEEEMGEARENPERLFGHDVVQRSRIDVIKI